MSEPVNVKLLNAMLITESKHNKLCRAMSDRQVIQFVQSLAVSYGQETNVRKSLISRAINATADGAFCEDKCSLISPICSHV